MNSALRHGCVRNFSVFKLLAKVIGGVANVAENIVKVGKLAKIIVAVAEDILFNSGSDESGLERRRRDFGEAVVNALQGDDDFIIGAVEVNIITGWDIEKGNQFKLRNFESGFREGRADDVNNFLGQDIFSVEARRQIVIKKIFRVGDSDNAPSAGAIGQTSFESVFEDLRKNIPRSNAKKLVVGETNFQNVIKVDEPDKGVGVSEIG